MLHGIARHLLCWGRPAAVGESPDVYFDRVARSVRARALVEVLVWVRRRLAARNVKRRLPNLAGTAPSLREGAQLSRLLLSGQSLPDKLTLLDLVFTAGGYETAATLAAALQDEVRAAPRAVRKRALPLFTRVWVTLGEAPRALAFWQTAGADLSPDHPSRQALLLGLGALKVPRFCSDHTFHPYLADACARADEVQQKRVLEVISARPWLVANNAEIDLVLHNLLRRTQPPSVSALNRYLRRHGLPGAQVEARGSARERGVEARGSARERGVEARTADPTPWLGALVFPAGASERGPLVSVIMSARNAAHTIAYAIDSVLRQTYRSLEILVADDASSDATPGVLQERYASDPRVRIFRSAQNQGTYNVRNQLVELARGDFVTFQDADDLSLPTRLSRQLASIRSAHAIGCVSDWLRVRPDGSVAFFSNGKAARLSIVSLMVSRPALREVGPYPSARVGADLDVYRRLLRKYGRESVVRLATPLLLGLWSEQSLTRSALTQSLENGYRSPVRRRYSELVFRQDLFGAESVPESMLTEELRGMGNYLEPSLLAELGAESCPA